MQRHPVIENIRIAGVVMALAISAFSAIQGNAFVADIDFRSAELDRQSHEWDKEEAHDKQDRGESLNEREKVDAAEWSKDHDA